MNIVSLFYFHLVLNRHLFLLFEFHLLLREIFVSIILVIFLDNKYLFIILVLFTIKKKCVFIFVSFLGKTMVWLHINVEYIYKTGSMFIQFMVYYIFV